MLDLFLINQIRLINRPTIAFVLTVASRRRVARAQERRKELAAREALRAEQRAPRTRGGVHRRFRGR